MPAPAAPHSSRSRSRRTSDASLKKASDDDDLLSRSSSSVMERTCTMIRRALIHRSINAIKSSTEEESRSLCPAWRSRTHSTSSCENHLWRRASSWRRRPNARMSPCV
ncbi:Os08g0229500 [Oryza sativa Japonica Group]|uniref:Os08g0229500 protein n=2 Tax=Oryza sativa subsp. japonica TaxID=39947 RepID=Q0J759_ORYSJ|nr:hypothetical protein EE612_042893 [Oryza sativa]BAF23206.1 Os08g0229500 [Oryza sativa Japonica Group]BAT04422.1 Os08g0229500 [Oryza sativa Japonica Group]|eukprot:NP_001061292.1 Os08g0229500 [Oryza sativa Japonica Group]